MQKLSREAYEAWRVNAVVLEKDRYGEKVLRLADGTFLKLFRRKRWLSKNTLIPPAKRFADNALRLKRLGIPCPTVLDLYKLSHPYRSAVHYHPIAGTTLRDLLTEEARPEKDKIISQLGRFIQQLHQHGVYFRSLHLGNIVLTPDEQLGLIDISDLRCFGKPLSNRMRKRNYAHIMRYENDRRVIGQTLDRIIAF